MSESSSISTVNAFLAGARSVVDAIGSDVVTQLWTGPSVLEEQSIGSLAGHLARGGVWVVSDYLSTEEPSAAVSFESAGAYFAAFAQNATEADHRAVRERAAEVASRGRDEIVGQATEALRSLERQLPELGVDRRVTVFSGAVMRLEDYLQTRIVEQVVHLDDLARSVGAAFEIPAECERVALEVALDISIRRYGTDSLVRALYRRGFADGVFPVL